MQWPQKNQTGTTNNIRSQKAGRERFGRFISPRAATHGAKTSFSHSFLLPAASAISEPHKHDTAAPPATALTMYSAPFTLL